MRLKVFVAWRTVNRTQGPPDRTCILAQAEPLVDRVVAVTGFF
jgi:hypothetical protein